MSRAPISAATRSDAHSRPFAELTDTGDSEDHPNEDSDDDAEVIVTDLGSGLPDVGACSLVNRMSQTRETNVLDSASQAHSSRAVATRRVSRRVPTYDEEASWQLMRESGVNEDLDINAGQNATKNKANTSRNMPGKLQRPTTVSSKDRSARVNGRHSLRQATKVARGPATRGKEQHKNPQTPERQTRGQQAEDVYEVRARDESPTLFIQPDEPGSVPRRSSKRNVTSTVSHRPHTRSAGPAQEGPLDDETIKNTRAAPRKPQKKASSKGKGATMNNQPADVKQHTARKSPTPHKHQLERNQIEDRAPKRARGGEVTNSRNLPKTPERQTHGSVDVHKDKQTGASTRAGTGTGKRTERQHGRSLARPSNETQARPAIQQRSPAARHDHRLTASLQRGHQDVLAEEEQEEEERDDEYSDAEKMRLVQQYPAIDKLQKYILRNGMNGHRPQTKPHKNIRNSLLQIENVWNALQTGVIRDSRQALNEIDKQFASVKNNMKWPLPETFQSVKEKKDLADDVYKATVPNLAKMFVIACFLEESKLDADALQRLVVFVDDMATLRGRTLAVTGKKPDKGTNENIVQPLNAIRDAFRKRREDIRDQQRRRAALQHRQEEARRIEAEQATQMVRFQHEEEWKQEQEMSRVLKNRINQLYTARRLVEPDRGQWKRLGVPPLFPKFDRDFNGADFERVEVFRPRLQAAKWSAEQQGVLLSAMDRFRGADDLFIFIIKTQCGVDQRTGMSRPLRDFTVLDILSQAASLQRAVLEANGENVFVEVPRCLRGELPDLDLIDFIQKRFA